MATSFYFNQFNNSPEQLLIEDLVIESIRVFGHDVIYLPRKLIAKDDVYNEDTISQYNKAYDIEMYIKSYDSYEGDGVFLSKFNLEIRDQMTFVIAARTFANEIGDYESLTRPGEGDRIWIPMTGRLMVIKYVNKTGSVFYQMGAIQMYDLVCEMFEYSNEKFNTGNALIDAVEKDLSFSMETSSILTQDKKIITDQDGFSLIQGNFDWPARARDPYEDNEEIEAEADAILDFTEVNPFSEESY